MYIVNRCSYSFREFFPTSLQYEHLCVDKWYFVTKNCSEPTVRKNCSSDQEKLLKFEAAGPRICKMFEITRTIYSNSERSKQFLKQIAVSTYS